MSVRLAIIAAVGLVVFISMGIGWLAFDFMKHDASWIGHLLAWGSIAVAIGAIWSGVRSARRAISRKEVQQ